MQEKFTIFPRASKKHKQVYYVRFRDPDSGERMTAVSSGHTTKSGARNWAIEQIQAGNIDRKSKVNFSVYTKEWFVWDKCPYVKLMLSKGHRFSRSYAENRRGYLLNHLQPFFGTMKIGDIGVSEAEGFLSHMQAKGYSPSSVNNAFSTFSIIMQEAVRQGKLHSNPLDKVKCVVKTTSIKENIPLDIAKKLFDPSNLSIFWNDSLFHYCFNLIAFTTGLRQAEILALRQKDIKDGYLEVNHTWDRKYGLKAPKYESNRIISLPEFTLKQLKVYINSMLQEDPDGLLFHRSKDIYHAADHKLINKFFHKALKAAGIDTKECNITFHSWRHTFNSFMRGKVTDAKLQRLTGHKSVKMLDHYTHFNAEDYKDVIAVQNTLMPVA